MTKGKTSAVREVIAKHRGEKRALIPILQDVQDHFRWLSPEILEEVARELDISLAHVYSVATFYKSFSLEPRGRHVCTVCMGTACHVRGADAVLERFKRRLGIEPGQTTADGEYTLERVNCLGACALAPLAIVDRKYFGQMTEAKVETVLSTVVSPTKPAPGRRRKAGAAPKALRSARQRDVR
ncbi:MAG TPA: NADH-quinone oxidoreductase subunit NuoE [Burkholderiales bacterium]|nr:NADH-quinone oxidoreductase subunit NuoE [Burkholderiales bacterium]